MAQHPELPRTKELLAAINMDTGGKSASASAQPVQLRPGPPIMWWSFNNFVMQTLMPDFDIVGYSQDWGGGGDSET